MAEPLLALSKLEVAYGGIQAVKGIDLHVDPGELVCLIGANGAGKTTTLKGVCGLLPVKSGTIRYAGEDVTGCRSHTLVERGLAMVPEGRRAFPLMSVKDNLLMGAFTRTDKAEIEQTLENVLTRFPRLRERYHQQANTMSG